MQHKVLILFVCVCSTFAFVIGAYSESSSNAYASGGYSDKGSNAYPSGDPYYNSGSGGDYQLPFGDPIYGYPLQKPNFDYNTYLPIAVLTSNCTAVQANPLIVYINRKSVLQSQNNGFTIYTTPTDNNAGYLTGGPCGKDKYIFTLIAQNNDQWPNNTRVSTTIDGIGTAFQIQVFYYNEKYGNLTNALNYRDGLFITLFDILVNGVLPNKLFYPYQDLLQKLVKYNSTSQINNYNALYWLYSTLKPNYFSYPGSFIDILNNRKQYFCASIIQGNIDRRPRISYDQFYNSVARVENLVGQLQANPLGLFSPYGRPIVEVLSKIKLQF